VVVEREASDAAVAVAAAVGFERWACCVVAVVDSEE
jgi:hypothetical protein